MCGFSKEELITVKEGGSYRKPTSIRAGWLSRRLARKGYTGVDVWFDEYEGKRRWWATMYERSEAMLLGRNIKIARVNIDALAPVNRWAVAV